MCPSAHTIITSFIADLSRTRPHANLQLCCVEFVFVSPHRKSIHTARDKRPNTKIAPFYSYMQCTEMNNDGASRMSEAQCQIDCRSSRTLSACERLQHTICCSVERGTSASKRVEWIWPSENHVKELTTISYSVRAKLKKVDRILGRNWRK